MKINSKISLNQKRVIVRDSLAKEKISSIFLALGCSEDVAVEVAEHLTDTSLCGMESHGVMRVLQYAEQYQSGYLSADASPSIRKIGSGCYEVDGDKGIGIPAINIAFKKAMQVAENKGLTVFSIKNVGHTGRHGAFADLAANKGFLTFLMGGGNRKKWRQVAPYGGISPKLPTNPWCVGIPGGNNGPVVIDFATSKLSGGWIYAAKSASGTLPPDCLIDKNGNPSQNPNDYFDGGAILPAGEHKGYSLALMAELIGEALLGPVVTEANWLLICIDTKRFNNENSLKAKAEEILKELRNSAPAPGHERVEIPGEREREHRELSKGKLSIPKLTWKQICDLEKSLNASF